MRIGKIGPEPLEGHSAKATHNDLPAEKIPSFEPLNQYSPAGRSTSEAAKHLAALRRSAIGKSQVSDYLLPLQRSFGNRYVQRIVALSQNKGNEEEQKHYGQIGRSPEADAQNGVGPHAAEAVAVASASSGQPLPQHLRSRFEQTLGADLSDVRVHTGADSIIASNAISARAYATGQNIHFNAGEYNPDTQDGQHLLAHEVAHTVQQGTISTPSRQAFEVSRPGDALEVEAEQVAGAMMEGRGLPVSRTPSSRLISRAEGDSSVFKGWAGIADERGIEAARDTGGFAPVKVSTEYAIKQAERKSEQIEAYASADIAFVSQSTMVDRPEYKHLINLRQEYLDDIERIDLAQGAYNDFVSPATLANKSVAQLEMVQSTTGFSGYSNDIDDLTGRERSTLSTNLDPREIDRLDRDVDGKRHTANGFRLQILGESHKLQAAMQKQAAILAGQQKGVAEGERREIEEKIKAKVEVVETVSKVMDLVGAGPGLAHEMMEGGLEGLEHGVELGGKGTTLIGGAVGEILENYYREDIEKVKTEILSASTALDHANKLDASLSYDGSKLTQAGLVENLEGAMSALGLAIEARKSYYAKAGAVADKAAGNKAGGPASQYLVFLSQAKETKSFIESAKAAAAQAQAIVDKSRVEMYHHRHESYSNANSIWTLHSFEDETGPDVEQLLDLSMALENFDKSASKHLESIDSVIQYAPQGGKSAR
jgi:hypothetical protein